MPGCFKELTVGVCKTHRAAGNAFRRHNENSSPRGQERCEWPQSGDKLREEAFHSLDGDAFAHTLEHARDRREFR